MSKNLEPGTTIPDLHLYDDNGVRHRLSELQADNVLVLHLSRGEHCPRERMFHRELLRFHEWCSVAFTELVSILPNSLHDVSRLKLSTGARWTFLSDEDLEVQRHFHINEYTDTHHDYAAVPAHADPLPGPADREGLRRLLVLGPPDGAPALAGPRRRLPGDQARLRPHHLGRPRRLGGGNGARRMRQNTSIARRPWLARDPRSEHVRRLIAGAMRRLAPNGPTVRKVDHARTNR
jgi:peroxiredoxin